MFIITQPTLSEPLHRSRVLLRRAAQDHPEWPTSGRGQRRLRPESRRHDHGKDPEADAFYLVHAQHARTGKFIQTGLV